MMKFHPEKCTVIRISPNRRQIIHTNYEIHGHTLEIVDRSKYLVVTISEDFSWKKHIETTVNKTNKTLGFVRRNLSDFSPSVKSAPTLLLHDQEWNTPPRDVHNLEQVQRNAVRFVHRNYTERTGCVTNMVQNLGWESLDTDDIPTDSLCCSRSSMTLLTSLQTSFNRMINAPEDPNVYARFRPQTTYTSFHFILAPSTTGIGCLHLSPTTRLFRDSGKA